MKENQNFDRQIKYVGPHVSIAGGFMNAPQRAMELNATAFAIFTKSPKGWNASDISDDESEHFQRWSNWNGYTTDLILPHASYIINIANPDLEKRNRSRNLLITEMKRCEKLGLDKLNFHPGAHLKAFTNDEACDLIASEMNDAIEAVPSVKLIIENTAGQGSNVGYTFEQIRRIIDRINDKSKVGVCIDTCHAFAAGYDFVNDYDKIWEDFANIIGFEYLSGMHLNDSIKACGSHVDRHASLGEGLIGIDFFERLMQDDRFNYIPLILETPNPDKWKYEIDMLKNFIGEV